MDNEYMGMTVNERLYVSGLMDDFDKAVKEKNVGCVIDVLKKIEITDENAIQPILKKMGLQKDL